jgi:hypothetical protein
LFGQSGQRSPAFTVFALIVLPTLYELGIFNFARWISSSLEDLLHGRAINRIRNCYKEAAGNQGRYLMLGGYDDPIGVLANMGIDHPSRSQLLYTVGAMIAFDNAIVGGSAVGLAAAVPGADLPVAIVIGALCAILSVVLHLALATP